MKYNKQSLPTAEHIGQLKKRGLSISDDHRASRYLDSIANITSAYQELTFTQLQIYYSGSKYHLNKQFTKNLDLLTADNNYNYAAYLLADRNDCSIKVAKYQGVDRADLIENEQFGYCSLVKATKAVLEKLKIENRTFTKITTAERLEKTMLDPVAMREVVINAIVHNDFSNKIAPKFELFSDRLEITSAGQIANIFSESEFFMGYSVPHNKELMRIFRDLDLAQQMGSGIKRILQKYPQSIYHFADNFIRVTLPYADGFVESQTASRSNTHATGNRALHGSRQKTMQAAMQENTQENTQGTTQGATQGTTQDATQDTVHATTQAKQVLKFCKKAKTRNEIQQHLGLKNREHFRKNILVPLINSGQLLLTIPEKPTSPNQQFYSVQSKNEEG